MPAKYQEAPTLGRYPQLYPYVMDHIGEPSDEATLRETVAEESRAVMLGAPDEAQFLRWLCATTGAKTVVEVGVFRGTTTLALARAIPKDGTVYGLDITDQYVEHGRAAWAAAGVSDNIKLVVGPATESMAQLLAGEHTADGKSVEGTVDFVFIDADKENYPAYYELAVRMLRPGGIIAVDNVLWGGGVIDPVSEQDDSTKAIVAINEVIKKDPRVDAVMLPIADGCYMARKL